VVIGMSEEDKLFDTLWNQVFMVEDKIEVCFCFLLLF